MFINSKKNYIIFDDLPNDILDNCYKYIYYPQSKDLLNEIKINVKSRIMKKIFNYDPNNLIDIHYLFLIKWYHYFAFSLLNELDNEQNATSIYILSLASINEQSSEWFLLINELIKELPIEHVLEVF